MPRDVSVSQPEPHRRVETLKKRRDFLKAAADGRRWVTSSFVLQIAAADHESVRFGYTATRKLGNAVTRNFAKRRMRILAARLADAHCDTGHDYVMIARDGMLGLPFASIEADLAKALSRVRTAKPRPRKSHGSARR